jgi:putative ABC transport system substrate-binding protein
MASYASEDVDAIIAIATPTAQAAQNYSDEIPVIFSAVSDPVGAGLVESTDAPGTNITGTSDEVQVDQIIDLILEILPDTKTVGVLYNASEANSVTNIANFKEYAETKGLEVVEKTGTDLTTMQQAASSLVKDVDVLFSPNDNTVASGMNALADIAAQAGVPYFVGADSMVQDGGFATVGIDYEELGRETARMTVDILNGADPATTAVKIFKTDLNVYVNQSILDQLGIELPDSVANNEKLIIVE